MSVKIGSAEDLDAEHAFMDDDHMDAVLRAFKNSEKPEKFYSDDQPRDDHGRWSPGGGGGVGVGGAARERARVAQHKKDLVTGLRKWQDLVDMRSDINVHNTPEIAKIRGAASEIASRAKAVRRTRPLGKTRCATCKRHGLILEALSEPDLPVLDELLIHSGNSRTSLSGLSRLW